MSLSLYILGSPHERVCIYSKDTRCSLLQLKRELKGNNVYRLERHIHTVVHPCTNIPTQTVTTVILYICYSGGAVMSQMQDSEIGGTPRLGV